MSHMAIWYNMETIRAQVEEKKARVFRKRAMEKYGHSKGAISMAVNKAIGEWLDRHEAKKSAIKASELIGIVSDLKDTSSQAKKKAAEWFGGND